MNNDLLGDKWVCKQQVETQDLLVKPVLILKKHIEPFIL